MRELLFRGKRTDNGVWVYGFLTDRGVKGTVKENLAFINGIEVDASTVGQFTGLTDINGTKIFEGDIIKHRNNCSVAEYAEDIGRVFYYGETSRFLRTSKLFPDDCPELYANRKYEVVGNICDTPNLLGGENEKKDIV